MCKQHLELGFDLTEFHEFCCLPVSAGGYQEIRKKGPHVGVGFFKRKQKNPQAHGYRCSLHPGVFQSIDFPQRT